MTKLFLVRILIFFSFFSFAQDSIVWNSKKDIIKIPFELSQNLMIVDVVFNNVKLKMIVDTGSDINMFFSLPEKDSIVLSHSEKIQIRGVGSNEPIDAYLSKNNILKIRKYFDLNFEIVLIPNQEISIISKLGIPINGILGSSFFKKFLVEIDYQKKNILLHKKDLSLEDKRIKKYKKIKIELKDNKPFTFLPIDISGKVQILKLLFDTGLGDGLWLFENDTLKSNNNYFMDLLGVGLSGEIYGKKSRVDEIKFNDLDLKKVLVSYPDSLSFKQISIIEGRNGSLGGDVLKRFNWFIDYKNGEFFFKKNDLFEEPFEYNMSGIEIQHSGFQWVSESVYKENGFIKMNMDNNVFQNSSLKYNYILKPIFEIYSIRKDSPGDKVGLKVGDKVLKINNKLATQLTIQKIIDLFQSEEGKPITIVVEREGKILTFKFNLEKVL